MTVFVQSFAKINLGLRIGTLRPDGFHELRTVYQTIALHDEIRVAVVRGSGIEIHCADERVPKDESNTCYRIAQRAMAALRAKGRVVIDIEKRLPVQGGLGGASGNAVAALLGLERALKKNLTGTQRFEIAAAVGSDLPLFLVGGTVLGVGRGEEVYPLLDLPSSICVVATPELGVSTPQAFKDWDLTLAEAERSVEGKNQAAQRRKSAAQGASPGSIGASGQVSKRRKNMTLSPKLTQPHPSDRMIEFSQWLSAASRFNAGEALSGVPGNSGRGRAGNPLLDLVRTGIENDFEQVVFPKYPELREVKQVLQAAGAFYASLSGSGSAIYGLFASTAAARKAARRLSSNGVPSVVTRTLRRRQYWKAVFDC